MYPRGKTLAMEARLATQLLVNGWGWSVVKWQCSVAFVELCKKACEAAVGWPSWEGSAWPCFAGSLKRPIEGFPFEEETLSFRDPVLLGRKHYFQAKFYPNYLH